MTRRQLREGIFKVLFRVEFISQEECLEQFEMHLQELEELNQEEEDSVPLTNEKDAAYIRNKVQDIFAHLNEIDDVIAEYAEGWKLNRIGKAELAILRLAVYEMQFDEEVPQGVAINEAVELTKRYCAEDAKGFVNAILGKLAAESKG